MNEQYQDERRLIREALEQTCPEIGTHIVTNWVMVCERIDTNGDPYLSQFSGTASDDCPAIWLRRGMLHHALTMLDEPTEDDDD